MATALSKAVLGSCRGMIQLILCTGAGSGKTLSGSGFMLSLPPNTIYVSAGRSMRDIKTDGIDVSRLFWIDASGKLFRKEAPEKNMANCSFMENANALSHLSLVVSTMSAGGNHNPVVLDSLDDLLAANGQEKTLKFATFLISKFKGLSMGALFVVRNPSGKGVSALLKPLAREMDGTVEI